MKKLLGPVAAGIMFVGGSCSSHEATPPSTYPQFTEAPQPTDPSATVELGSLPETTSPTAEDLKGIDLGTLTCGALALQSEALGPIGMPPLAYNDDSVGGRGEVIEAVFVNHYALSTVLPNIVMDSLTDDNGMIPFDPAIRGPVADAIGAADTTRLAGEASAIVFDLSPRKLRGERGDEAVRDAMGLLDQARMATDTALQSGCSNIAPSLLSEF